MDSLLIKGGIPLHGEVTVGGAKNAVLPILAATLLTAEPCVIRRVPDLSDVTFMGQILTSLGASVKLDGDTMAIQAAKMPMDPNMTAADLNARIPAHVRWKADNYNHLMEQPTIFYATCLALAVAGLGEGLNAWLAWGYVGLRVIHSLVQATANIIMLRFSIFMLASLVLAALAVHGAMGLF